MNNFTKEELEEIESSLIFKMDKGNPTPDKFVHDLVDKIQSMIDNYSEIKPPTMADYCCGKCNEEWHKCECGKCQQSAPIKSLANLHKGE